METEERESIGPEPRYHDLHDPFGDYTWVRGSVSSRIQVVEKLQGFPGEG